MSVDEWIDDARRTERLVSIYQRADLLADLDELDLAIDVARRANDVDALADLDTQWQATAQTFSNSALHIRVRGLSGDEIRALKAEASLNRSELDETSAAVIAAATVEPKLTTEQVLRLVQTIGDAQVVKIAQTVTAACLIPAEVKHG